MTTSMQSAANLMRCKKADLVERVMTLQHRLDQLNAGMTAELGQMGASESQFAQIFDTVRSVLPP